MYEELHSAKQLSMYADPDEYDIEDIQELQRLANEVTYNLNRLMRLKKKKDVPEFEPTWCPNDSAHAFIHANIGYVVTNRKGRLKMIDRLWPALVNARTGLFRCINQAIFENRSIGSNMGGEPVMIEGTYEEKHLEILNSVLRQRVGGEFHVKPMDAMQAASVEESYVRHSS